MAVDGRQAALDNALKQIEKDFGKGAIMRLGEAADRMNVEVISSGSLAIDIAVGVGGFPRGRVIEIYGPESSGKTTVALHRIAYLVYTYEKEFNPDEFLIIAPNKFFLDYISNVLPDLGVDYVRQQTFEEFMLENIDANFEINPINVELSNIVNQNGKTDLIKKSANFKSSLRFKELIDEFIDKFLKSNLPKGDFKISDIVVFNHDEVIDMFINYFKNNSINDSKKMLTAILQKRVSNIANELIDRLSEQRKSKFTYCIYVFTH